MRVLVFTESLAPIGGVEVQTVMVCRGLVARGHQVDVLYLRDGELRSELESVCRRVTKVPGFTFSRRRPVEHLGPLLRTVWTGVRSRPDVLYVQRTGEIRCGALIGRLSGGRVVCHLHGFRPGAEPLVDGAKVARSIAVSLFIQQTWEEAGVRPGRVEVVHNGVDTAAFAPATPKQREKARLVLGLPQDGFVLLYFGRLDVEKGIEVLFDAWRRIALAPEAGQLVLMGSPTIGGDLARRMSDLRAIAPESCLFLPSGRDVLTALHASDVVAVPSTMDEPFGRVVVEGLAAGLPVVASRVGGIPEILDGNLASMLFERGSAVELAERLVSLVDWRRDRPELGEQCALHAAENFGISSMIDGIERVMLQVADRAERA